MSQPIRLIWIDWLKVEKEGGHNKIKLVLILAVTTFTVALYVVSRLVLSPIVTRPAAQQQHRVSWVGWWVVGWMVQVII